jgi:hypothetical protein
MSMKWLGVSIIRTNIIDPTATSTTNKIQSSVPEPESRYQVVAASLLPVATVAGDKLHYICIKMT